VKQILMCLAFSIALAVITMSAVLWGLLPAVNCAAAGALVMLIALRGVVQRDARVRRLIVTAYDAGSAPVQLGDVARVLGTPDVVQARRDHLRREELDMAQRYANGDASDF
jgi:predicted anti-sigma-YlaC factor YlaD